MGMDGYGYGIGLDLCVGLFYEHRFAVLINDRKVVLSCTEKESLSCNLRKIILGEQHRRKRFPNKVQKLNFKI